MINTLSDGRLSESAIFSLLRPCGGMGWRPLEGALKRAIRFVAASAAMLAAFLGTWLAFEAAVGVDRDTALALGGLASGLAGSICFSWVTLIHGQLDTNTTMSAAKDLVLTQAPIHLQPDPPDSLAPSRPGESGIPFESSREPQPPPSTDVAPRAWNTPARNPDFIGRKKTINALRRRLLSGKTVTIQALHGMGGVGKTQLSIEYAYRYAEHYDIVWFFAAERDELLGEQYSALAAKAGLVKRDIGISAAVRIVREYLRLNDGWLIVFDNANDPWSLREWLPSGPGHVIITSRDSSWREIATPLAIDVFDRTESVRLLTARVPDLGRTNAARLAHDLGDLPLALSQAAGVMSETGMSEHEYKTALKERAASLLDQGISATYPQSLAATLRISAGRVRMANVASAQLLGLCACLAPEPIPLTLFSQIGDGVLPIPLSEDARDPILLRRAVGVVRRFGLVRVDKSSLQVHRLTQAVLRSEADSLVDGNACSVAQQMVVAANPNDTDSPETWTAWAALMPHVLAQNPAASQNQGVRKIATDMVWYLLGRGEADVAISLAEEFRESWLQLNGEDDPDAIWIGNHLARAYAKTGASGRAMKLQRQVYSQLLSAYGENDVRTLAAAGNLGGDLRRSGDFRAALKIDQDVLSRRRVVLGEDHPDTLRISNGIARDLRRIGAVEEALAIDEDVLTRMRRILGEDHVYTLTAANSAAFGRRVAGDLAGARELDEDTLRRRRIVLGEDHPSTLMSASNLARDLSESGEWLAARMLDEDTLQRRQRTLGKVHPDTLVIAEQLIRDLNALGDIDAARRLEQEISNLPRNAGEPSEPDGS